MKTTFIFFLFLLMFSTFHKNLLSQTTGPESGTLLIIGGNANDEIYIPLLKNLQVVIAQKL